MKQFILAGLLTLLIGVPALADEIAVGEGLVLSLTLPAGWTLHSKAPEVLVHEIAKHIAHEANAMGKHPSQAQTLQAARKRLAANEAIAYHAASGSHLDLDFSPLGDRERPPSTKQLRQSAEFAVQSLEGETEVSNVESAITEARVHGSAHAYRLTATYQQHEQPVTFIGLIGYAQRHWFFFYFTAPGQEPEALQTIEGLLASLQIKTP